MQYMAAYRFIFSNPKWFTIVLIGCVCMLVPVAGPMVFIGYMFEIIEFFHRRHEESKIPMVEPAEDAIQTRPTSMRAHLPEESYPNFNTNQLSDYLVRGVWPVLVNMVVALPIMMAVGFFFFVSVMLISAAGANEEGGVVVGIMVAMAVVYSAAMLALAVVQVPFYLRAGLGRDFGSAFSIDFFKDFMRRVGRELILAKLFLFAGSLVLMIVGVLACYFGLYPAAIIATMATHYMDYLLYELYLERGGASIVPVR
jgi:hypothetical protein